MALHTCTATTTQWSVIRLCQNQRSRKRAIQLLIVWEAVAMGEIIITYYEPTDTNVSDLMTKAGRSLRGCGRISAGN
jgi:hypothetical protein